MTAGAALVFGLVPAWRALEVAPARALKVGAAAPDRRRSAAMRALVVAEVGLAAVLLVGAGLLVQTLRNHFRLERGFATENLVSVRLSPPAARAGLDDMRALYDELVPGLLALPGVAGASPVLNHPFATSDGYDAPFTVEGQSTEEAESNPLASFEAPGSGYLEALGLPLLDGRFFASRDRADAEPVAVVNHALSERFWPGGAAVGQRVKLGRRENPTAWRRIVGVVGDARWRHATDVRPVPSRPST